MTSSAPTLAVGGGLPADRLVGVVLEGRYRVGARLAEGGMASVHVAVDERLDRPVAVKVMHPALAADPRFVARFREEARSAARLSHPHVVAVTDQGVHTAPDGSPLVFLVMELVDGITVRDLLGRRGRLGTQQVLELLEPVCAALGAAHEAGLVHRDVKPENVLLGDDGRVLVADFGLARAVEASPVTAAAGLLLGTVAYLAPEQVARGTADARTDVYALGVMTFELLTGQVPFHAETPLAVAYKHLHERVPAPSSVVGAGPTGVPPGMDALVAAATAQDPEQRPADARVLLGMVRRLQRDLRDGAPAPSAPRTEARNEARTEVIAVPPAPKPDAAPTEVIRAAAVVPTPGWQPPVWQPSVPPPPRQVTAVRHRTAELAVPVPKKRRRLVTRGRVALLLLLVVTAGAAAAGWWLADGRWTRVPQLVGLSASQSTLEGKRADVRTELGASVYDDSVAEGLVAAQDAPVGSRLVRGRTVTVHVSMGARTVPVPTVRGSASQAAQDALTAVGLQSTVSEAYDPTVAAGAVVSSSPGVGTAAKVGSTVALVVSKGPAPVAVPKVVDLSQADAATALRRSGFTTVSTAVFDDDVDVGVVISQVPGAGTLLQPGQAVTLTVSKGPDVVEVPDVRGDSTEHADDVLRDAGLVPKHMQLPPYSDTGVVSQSDRGKLVKRGSTVTVYTV